MVQTQARKIRFLCNTNDEQFLPFKKFFDDIAKEFDYPNLTVDNTDCYQGLVNVVNLRTGKTIYQACEGQYVEFCTDGRVIFNVDGPIETRRVYEEENRSLKEVTYEISSTTVERFKNTPKYQPYDKLHSVPLGSAVIWGNNHYLVTGVEQVADCNLINIVIGNLRIRSDDFLKDCRFTDGRICGWLDEKEGENPT